MKPRLPTPRFQPVGPRLPSVFRWSRGTGLIAAFSAGSLARESLTAFAGLVLLNLALHPGRLAFAGDMDAKTTESQPAAAAPANPEAERRIAQAAQSNLYEDAARLSQNLLGDYQHARGYWRQRWDQLQTSGSVSIKWRVAWESARCCAHLGDFKEVDAWAAQMQKLEPLRNIAADLGKETDLCRHWVPIRDACAEKFQADPSLENARALLRAHVVLNEYAGMRRLVEPIASRYGADPWTQSEEFQSVRRFITAYFAPPPPGGAYDEPPPAPAQNQQVESIFRDLRANSEKKRDFARGKWDHMPVIERAKFVNRECWDPDGIQPERGWDWEPNEQQATQFLDSRGLGAGLANPAGAKETENQRRAIEALVWRLTKEELAPFQAAEDSLLQALAATGQAAVPDLLAKVQTVSWGSPIAIDASWAGQALGRMGEAALPVLVQRLDEALKAKGRYIETQRLVDAVARTGSPNAIPALRRALESSDTATQNAALTALQKLPQGLSQDMLLTLWEGGDENLRQQAARLLGQSGDQTALAALQRDIPDAYAGARRQAEQAVWDIQRRQGENPGSRPEPIPRAMYGPDTFYDDLPKSLKSPNAGIRLTAVNRLAGDAEKDDGVLALLAEAARSDPDRQVRLRAIDAVAGAFSARAWQLRDKGELPASLAPLRDTLVEIAATGDEDAAAAVLGCMASFRSLGKDPAARNRVIARILDGMNAPSVPFRAQCVFALSCLLYDDAPLIKPYITPQRREAILKAVLSGLSSPHQRYPIDAMSVAEELNLTEAVPALVELVKGAKTTIYKTNAAQALGKIGGREAIPALEQMATTEPWMDQWGRYPNRETAWRAIQSIRQRLPD